MKKPSRMRRFCTLALAGLTVFAAVSRTSLGKSQNPHVRHRDGIIQFFPGQPEDAVIARERIGGKDLWVGGVRRDGSTRQVRITNYMGGRGAKPSVVRLRYPFGNSSATWNMEVKREGDVVSAMLPWNGTLIGDIMDVNEGEDAAEEARRRLGTTAAAVAGLPVLYSSGDSISMGYWPYLEGELHDTINVYYQRELAKDMPGIGLRNNGHAHLAYGVLQAAYKDRCFRPDYVLINFGLHMIRTHHRKVQEYGAWIEKFAALAKAEGARMIWVNTTPYQQSFRPRQNETIKAFNAVATEVAGKHGVPVIDLHACMLEQVKAKGDKVVFTDGVHFTEETKKRQAAFIAKRIREICGTPQQQGQAPPAFADRLEWVGLGVHSPGHHVWGSSPVMDDDGKMHIFAARWKPPFDHGWRDNSEIVHFVSNSPEGPFTFSDVALRGTGTNTWDRHAPCNPLIKRVDGKYVLLYIANPVGMTKGKGAHVPSQRIGMALADSPNGPWKKMGDNGLILRPSDDPRHWTYRAGNGVNNPAFLKAPDGRYFLYFKSARAMMGLAIAEKLGGPYIHQRDPVTRNKTAIEDGYAFMMNGKFHLLTTDNHGILRRGGGILWESTDGMSFTIAGKGFHLVSDYLPEDYAAKPRRHYGRQFKFERPLLLMIDGRPAYFYAPSGVQVDGLPETTSYILKFGGGQPPYGG